MSILKAAVADTGVPLERLENALNQVSSSGKSKLERDFKEAYPLLEQHLARKMRKKLLMEQFNTAYEHEITLIQFRKLLNAERERRKNEGQEVTCASCGNPLHLGMDQAAAATIVEKA